MARVNIHLPPALNEKIEAAIKIWGFGTKSEFLRTAAQRYLWDIEKSLEAQNAKHPTLFTRFKTTNPKAL